MAPLAATMTAASRHAASLMVVARHDRSFFTAGQASKTVVAKRELKAGVALGASHIRSVAGWHDDRQQHPPAGSDDHGSNGSQ